MSNLSTKPHKVICMTDSVGGSGGCQNLYTVYPSPTGQTCSGFTPPAQGLGMKAISLATQSPFARWGWPASCSDLQLEPIDDGNGGIKGTPPYTLTVAPAFRTPLNLTFGMLLFLSVASLTISQICNQTNRYSGPSHWTMALHSFCPSQILKVLLGRRVRSMLAPEPGVVCHNLPRTWRLTITIQAYTDKDVVRIPV